MTPICADTRLPTAEECNEHGCCWCWIPYGSSWALMESTWCEMYKYWLPYQAIPELHIF